MQVAIMYYYMDYDTTHMYVLLRYSVMLHVKQTSARNKIAETICFIIYLLHPASCDMCWIKSYLLRLDYTGVVVLNYRIYWTLC